MKNVLTRSEFALLEALETERTLGRRRALSHGIVLHEMSNALTGLLGGVELLELNLADAAYTGASMQEIRRSGQHMREMLSGLRVLSDEGREAPRFVAGPLEEFVREVVRSSIDPGEAVADRLRIERRGPDRIRRYVPALLRHALGNLVRNALRYGDPAEPVRVCFGGARPGQFFVSVLNRGPKIPAEIAARLFEPGRKHRRGGMGLGLHIAETCAVRMGGRLVFGSTTKATVFSILLGEPTLDTAPEWTAESFVPGLISPLRREAETAWGTCRGA